MVAMPTIADPEATTATRRSTNPVLPGFHPDPSITRGADAYYLVTSSFEYLPGIPVYRSTDLDEWHIVGNVIDRAEQLDLSHTGAWRGVGADDPLPRRQVLRDRLGHVRSALPPVHR